MVLAAEVGTATVTTPLRPQSIVTPTSVIFAHLKEPLNQPGSPRYRDIKNKPVFPTELVRIDSEGQDHSMGIIIPEGTMFFSGREVYPSVWPISAISSILEYRLSGYSIDQSVTDLTPGYFGLDALLKAEISRFDLFDARRRIEQNIINKKPFWSTG